MPWTRFFHQKASDSKPVNKAGRRLRLVSCVLFALLSTLPFPSLRAIASDNASSRHILVLFNSLNGQSAENNLFAEGFQLSANYHGLLPEYRDVVQRPLPDDEEMRRYRFVVSAYDGDAMSEPRDYALWLLRQFDAGRKLLVLGRLGATMDEKDRLTDPQLIAKIYAHLGLTYEKEVTRDMARLRYGYVDKEMMGFERPLPTFPLAYMDVDLLGQGGPDMPGPEEMKVLVRVKRKDDAGEGSPVVVYGPNGGIALTEYIYWMDSISFRKRWYLNPFEFLPAALGITSEPVLTPTTRNGIRVAFSHVDGDAFLGFTELALDKVCADILRDEIFTVYDLPFTLSVIVAEVGKEYNGNEKSMRLAREIFALPNVEPASHTFSHPYIWEKENRAKWAEMTEEDLQNELPALHGIKVKGYTFDPHMEIVGSCRYITEHLAPPEKPCKVLLWSGDCEPSAKQVAICDDNGLLNLNGGDSVKNDNTSFFLVSGLYRWVKGRYQIYTGQANENILTNLWTGPFYGFRNTVRSMEETGSPRRLMPVNPYYHFYSGEKYASVQALKDVYDWMLKQELCHIYASDYIRMVESFIHAHKERLAEEQGGGWAFSDYGTCASLRLPADAPPPDLERCENVLGYSRQKEGLFVHLAPDAPRAVLRLLANGEEPAAKLPWLERATGLVTEFSPRSDGISLNYAGYGSKGLVILAGLKPGTSYALSGSGVEQRRVESDAQGLLRLENVRGGTVELREP